MTSETGSLTFQGLMMFRAETDAWLTLKTLH